MTKGLMSYGGLQRKGDQLVQAGVRTNPERGSEHVLDLMDWSLGYCVRLLKGVHIRNVVNIPYEWRIHSHDENNMTN